MPQNANQHPLMHPLHQLYFYLTDACNCHCRHCWIEPYYLADREARHGLDVTLFEKILDQAKPLGLTGIKLTGGEPLIHPRISEILAMVCQKEIRLTVETNGTLCTPAIAAQLSDISDVFVAVSLDGSDAATHDWIRRKRGSFEGAIQGIKNLVHCHIRPQIIMTIMGRNKDQMTAVVRLAEALGAGSVKFNILQPTARGEHLFKTGAALEIEELIALGKWVEEELSSWTTLAVSFHQTPAFRSLGKMFGETGDGCQSCGILGILGILSDGSYALCGIGATVPELVFGHAATDSLQEIWMNNATLQQIREGLPGKLTGVCGRCMMKKVCLGSCLAQNYYRQNDLWAPFWYCEEAFQKGLFPETRLLPKSG